MQSDTNLQVSSEYDQSYVRVAGFVIGVGLDRETVELEREQSGCVLVECPNEPWEETHRLLDVRDVSEKGVIVETETVNIVMD